MSKMVGENGKNFPPAKLAEMGEKIIYFLNPRPQKNQFRFGGIPVFQKKLWREILAGKNVA